MFDDHLGEVGDECDAIFPVPGKGAERVWLLQALALIVRRVHWLKGLFGDPLLETNLERLKERADAVLSPQERDLAPSPMGGDFGLAYAMIGTGFSDQPDGILVFRGLLWIAIRHRRRRGRAYASSAGNLASALRSIATSPGDLAAIALDPILTGLNDVTTLDEAIGVLDGLTRSTHKTLQSTWISWFRPTLLEIGGSRPAEPGPRPPRAPHGGTGGPTGKIEYHLLRRRKRSPGQLLSEPAGEEGGSVCLALVPGFGSGALTCREAEYYARQAIWGSNYLLLPTHTEALFPDVFGAAVNALVQHLDDPTTAATDHTGWVGCLLKCITGRNTRALRAIHLGAAPDKDGVPGWYLDLDAGTLSFPPYWKQPIAQRQPHDDVDDDDDSDSSPSYFRPTPQQGDWLVPTTGYVALPLAAPIRRVLARHQDALRRLSTMEIADLDRRMAAVAIEVGRAVGVPVTVAKLRRSLGPLVMEACGDLAMAQLICGDSFGRPSAQQHYYTPRRKDVAAVYSGVIGQFFEESTSPRTAEAAARVGSELLVQPASARRLADASLRWNCECVAIETGKGRLVLDHRRILDHLVRMILATAGHRWASSLFQLKLGDFELQSGAVLFADKRHDVAHDPRLAALPKVVCAQLASYVRHIAALVEALPELRDELLSVLRGDAPVLFDLHEGEGRCEKSLPTVEMISERGPPEWRVLPENWGRTYIRTRSLEMGAPAFLIACQLGHYDAIGYPFSNQSPTEPIDVVLRLQPWLDRVAKTQGWKIMEAEATLSGTKAGSTACFPEWPRVALKDWRGVLRGADLRAQKAHRQWERALRIDARKGRDAAVAAVLGHPLLIEAHIAAAYLDEAEAPNLAPMDSLDFYRVRTELLVECEDDAALAVARLRALRHVLKVVSKRTNQPTPTVAIPIPVRRPLDNAFFAGACLGLSQVRALREYVGERSKVKRPDRGSRMQVARTAEALMLFGGVDDVETLMAVLSARSLARPSAKIPDLVLVPLARGRSLAFRGVAALALANLARVFPAGALPSTAQLEATLAGLLPPWAIEGGTSELLARLCSTVGLANRFEYSPAARFAIDAARGSVSATIDEQIAFIDGDPVGPKRETVDEPRVTHAAAIAVGGRSRAQLAMTQYDTLVQMIPTVGKAFLSPVTGKSIRASAIRLPVTRATVIAELRAWLDASDTGTGETLWSVVRMLGEWMVSELTRQKADGTPLEYISVKTYLTRIGKALTHKLGGLDAPQWAERVVEDAYEYAMGASREAPFKVAAALLSFHRCVEVLFDLPEVDLAPVYAELGQSERNTDAAMILPVERAVAFAAIAKRAWSATDGGSLATRIARQADATAPFLGYAGARLSEPMGLQVRDVGRRPSGMIWARFRSNQLRSLKTRAATRVAVFGSACDPQHLERTWKWVQAVRKNAGSNRPEGVYILSSVESRNDLGEQQSVARLIREELALTTGRPSERLHRLRHLVATERITATALSAQDSRWIGLPDNSVHERVLQPRDLHAVSVPLGHAHWMTTIQWYLHLPWVLQSRAAARLRHDYFNRRTVAGTLGVTPYTLDNLLRGDGNDDRVRVWFDHVRAVRAVPDADGDENVTVVTGSQWTWTAQSVGQLVAHAWRTKDLLAVLMLLGAPLAEADRIELCAARWERKFGLRLIPEYIGERRRDCPGRAVRRLEDDDDFEKIWRLLDVGSIEQQSAIRDVTADFFVYLQPRSGDKIELTATGADTLRGLLMAIGVPNGDVAQTRLPGDLVEISVVRRGTPDRVERYRGRGLKRVLAIAGLAIALQSSPVEVKSS